jgi:hypothetical protein
MRVEPSSSPPPAPQLSAEQLRPSTYSVESVLVPPQAPTFPRLARFFSWLWSWVRPLFFLCLPKKEPDKTAPPAPDVVQTIQAAQAKKNAPSLIDNAIDDLLSTGNIMGAAFAKYFRNIPTFVAQKSVTATQAAIEYIAKYTFPNFAPHWIKGTSFAIASVSVWYASNRLGYPMGWLYLGFTAFNVYNVVNQGLAQKQADRNQRIQRRMAGYA